MRVGMGYDVHKLTEGRKLILGGWRSHTKRGFLDIRMQTYFCMRSWMPCLERHHLEISESIFRIQILHTKGFPVLSFWNMWESCWMTVCM